MGESEILDQCVLGLKKCSEAKPCPMHDNYKTIKKQLIELFETKTIQQLADDINSGNVYINNKKNNPKL